jgi:hypothetical protein
LAGKGEIKSVRPKGKPIPLHFQVQLERKPENICLVSERKEQEKMNLK